MGYYTEYSSTAASNNSPPPVGAPEGMFPSSVDDTMREMMATIRTLGDRENANLPLTLTGNITLTATQANNVSFTFAGVGANVTWPPSSLGIFCVINNASGAVVCGMATGSTVSIAASSSALIAADGTNFEQISGGSSTPTTSIDFVRPEDHGAAGDGTTDDTAAINAWWTALMTSTKGVGLLRGAYKITSQLVLDPTPRAARGFVVMGAGADSSYFDVSSVSASPAMLISSLSNAALFYGVCRNFGVRANLNGTALRLGSSVTSDQDALNGFIFDGLRVGNSNTGSSAIAVEYAGLYNCHCNITADCGGSGSAALVDTLQFSVMEGSYSNAAVGVHFVNWYSFANVWWSVDLETVGVCVQADVATASQQTFIGGQFVWSGSEAVLLNTCSNWFRFEGVNPGVSGTLIAGADKGSGLWEDKFVGASPFGGILIQPASGADAAAAIAGASGQVSELLLQIQNGSGGQLQRWAFTRNNATESGSNVGSDLIVTRYDDAGASIDNPLSITRSTGIVHILGGAEIKGSWSLFGSAAVTAAANTTGTSAVQNNAGGVNATYQDTGFTGGIGTEAYTIGQLVGALKLMGVIQS